MATIRPRNEDDLEPCADILRVVYENSGYPVGGVADALGFLKTDGAAWVAEKDGFVIGHAALTVASEKDMSAALWYRLHPEDRNIVVLGRLFVHPDARKSGAATGLIDAAVAEGRRQGKRLVMFGLEKDQPALRLYQRLHWEHYGSTIFKWGEGKQMVAECFASPS
jgi:GNAT superfamily N-acetyltransferase